MKKISYTRQYPIDITPNGDNVQTGFTKTDDEFDEVYDALNELESNSSDITQRIDDRIDLKVPTMIDDASADIVATALSNPLIFKLRIFASSGTFTVPTPISNNVIYITGVGAGGAGGGKYLPIHPATTHGGGGGGGSGATIMRWAMAVIAGDEITVTVGSGGIRGTDTQDGGDGSFTKITNTRSGQYIQLGGGKGGKAGSITAGGAGGAKGTVIVDGGSPLSCAGENGETGLFDAVNEVRGGVGGSTIFGFGGGADISYASNAQGYGGGGAGLQATGLGSGAGYGGDGRVWIEYSGG